MTEKRDEAGRPMPGCCDVCLGTGIEPGAGPCWQCYASGHLHRGPCEPSTASPDTSPGTSLGEAAVAERRTVYFTAYRGKVRTWDDAVTKSEASTYVNRNNAAAARRGETSEPYAVLAYEIPDTSPSHTEVGR